MMNKPIPFVKTYSLLVCALIVGLGLPMAALADDRPNILLIMVDDMNEDTVDAVVDGQVVTPRINSLKDEGISFERAHVTVAVCQPSRQVLMTGLYPHQNGALGFVPIDESVTTLGEILSANGYYNGTFCKEHHLAPEHKFAWDVVGRTDDMYHGRNTDEFYTRTRSFIQQAQAANKPFFLMANSEDPHRPLHGTTDEDQTYGPSGQNIKQFFSTPSYEFSASQIDKLMPWVEPLDFNANAREKSEIDLAAYYSSCRRADDSVTVILNALEELGEKNNTIVIFMSDNGMAFPGAKWQNYQAATRTPFIVRWPDGGIVGGTVNTEDFICNIDFMPTILEAVGLEDQIPPGLPGESYLDLLTGATSPGRDSLVTAHYSATAPTPLSQDSIDKGYTMPPVGAPINELHMRCYQDENFAYIYNNWSDQLQTYIIGGDGGMGIFVKNTNAISVMEYRDFLFYRVPEEFYDMKNDPHSLNNLINDPAYQDTIETYRDNLRQWMVEQGDVKITEFDALRAALAAPPVEPMIGTATNYVANADFESGSLGQGAVPDSWQMGASTNHVNLIWTEELDGDRALLLHKQRINRDPFDAAYEIRMYNPSTDDFQASAQQTITVPNGTYCYKAKVRKQGAFYKQAHIFVDGYGGDEQRAIIPTSLEWEHVFIRDIEVTTGEITVGIDVDVFAGMWPLPYIYMDDVELFLQADATTNAAPEFVADPLVLTQAYGGVSYEGTVDGQATDLEERKLVYTIVSGPDWLHMAADGTISGTPEITDLGLAQWTIQTWDPQGGTDTTTLEINVVEEPNLTLGYTLQIDLGTNGPGPTMDAYWNQISSPSDSLVLRTSDNVTSPVTIGAWSGFQSMGGNPVDMTNPNAHDFSGSFWDVAISDAFVNKPASTGSFTLTGFQATDDVEIQAIAYNNAASNKDGDYQVNGEFGLGESPLNGDNYNARRQGWQNGEVITWQLSGETEYTLTMATIDGTRPILSAVRVIVVGNPVTLPSPLVDTDGDGIMDFTEFALSGSSTEATAAHMPYLTMLPDGMDYVINRTQSEGVTYAIEVSPNLNDWYRVAYRNNTDGSWYKDVLDDDGTPRFNLIDDLSVTETLEGVKVIDQAGQDIFFYRTCFGTE
jgi:N-sulfoglucosamine sulfohydrolase